MPMSALQFLADVEARRAAASRQRTAGEPKPDAEMSPLDREADELGALIEKSPLFVRRGVPGGCQ